MGRFRTSRLLSLDVLRAYEAFPARRRLSQDRGLYTSVKFFKSEKSRRVHFTAVHILWADLHDVSIVESKTTSLAIETQPENGKRM